MPKHVENLGLPTLQFNSAASYFLFYLYSYIFKCLFFDRQIINIIVCVYHIIIDGSQISTISDRRRRLQPTVFGGYEISFPLVVRPQFYGPRQLDRHCADRIIRIYNLRGVTKQRHIKMFRIIVVYLSC